MQPFSQVTEQFKTLRANVDRQGFATLKTRATPEACEYLKDFIDHFPEKDAEINYGGTEKRIWGSHRTDPVIKAFSLLSDQVMSEAFNSRPKLKTVLAYSNFPISPLEGLITGRWHIDSLRHQYKLFCFLTEVEEQTGPLEVVLGTHRTAFKFAALASGQYITLSNLSNNKRRYQKLDEQWVEIQRRKAGGSVPLLCKPGTIILVDTSAIHRARPCLEGQRYALTTYYDHF
jgi:hypothetical protein